MARGGVAHAGEQLCIQSCFSPAGERPSQRRASPRAPPGTSIPLSRRVKRHVPVDDPLGVACRHAGFLACTRYSHSSRFDVRLRRTVMRGSTKPAAWATQATVVGDAFQVVDVVRLQAYNPRNSGDRRPTRRAWESSDPPRSHQQHRPRQRSAGSHPPRSEVARRVAESALAGCALDECDERGVGTEAHGAGIETGRRAGGADQRRLR